MSTQETYKILIASILFAVFLAALAMPFVSGIRINEVMPKTPEFVEVYNPESEFINLSLWYIKDSSTNNPDEITCYNISSCSLLTNSNYFLIIGRNTGISSIAEGVTYFYVDDTSIGNGMNDDGDNITLYNSSFSTNLYYNSSETNKSWQFYNEIWQSCMPTPGSANSCQSQQQNQTNQTSNETQTNQTTQNTTQQNQTSQTNQTANQTAAQNQSAATALLYYPAETSGGENISVELYAYNLDNSAYDVKIFIYNSEGDVISDTYNENEGKFKSSTYYINSVFSGTSTRKNFTLSMRDAEFRGYANISVKLRKSGTSSIYIEYSGTISILKAAVSYNESIIRINPDEAAKGESAESNDGVIRLNNAERRAENQDSNLNSGTGGVVFMSKAETIKKYAIYGFAVFLILLILALIKYRRI